MASFLGAVVVASATSLVAAPAAFANNYDECVSAAHSAGLHKPDAKAACAQGEAGNADECAGMIAKMAKKPVKGNPDAAKKICADPAEPPED
jgi:hypothetical protein